MTGPDGVVLWSHQADIARRAARREPDLRRPRRRRGLTGLTSAPPPEPGPGDHVRGPEGARAVIVYGDYECPFCAALEARLHELELRVTFRHFPVRSAPPARPGRRARRRGGRAAGRVLAVPRRAVRRPGAPGGPAPVGARRARSGSTSSASTPTAAPTRSPSACARTSAAGSARGWRPRRRCSRTASATPGGPARSCGRRCAGLDRGSNRGQARAVYPRRPWPPATSSSSSACAPTTPARRCAPSTAPTRASCTASR